MIKMKLDENNLSLKLFIVLSRATRAVHDLVEDDIKKYGLNPTEFAVLELMYHKGDQPIQQIGKKVLLSSGSITYVVDKLEKKQLLLRKSCPKDRRVTYAVITDKGTELMDDIFPRHKQAIDQIFNGLNASEKEQLIELLKKLGYHARSL
jgi:MarR family transcriptional regulator, 2-MHQ and catechol-resistance regulon repressor